METDIGLTKQYIRKRGLVWIICIPPVVKDTKKENSSLDFLLDRDVNSILKMWNKGQKKNGKGKKFIFLSFISLIFNF